MKRTGDLYNKLYDWKNIFKAYHKAKSGKHSKAIDKFEVNSETELLDIQRKLESEDYQFGKYSQFHIYEPKERLISCALFKDRVVHHAICNIINPILDKSMIVDNYACRKGKGLHKALKRAFWFYQNTSFHYRFDIKKFYYTIDHEILKAKLQSKFKDPHLLRLLSQLIDSYSADMDYYYPFPDDDLSDFAL